MEEKSTTPEWLAGFEEHLRGELGRSPLTAEAYLRDLEAFAAYMAAPDGFAPDEVATNDVRSFLADRSRRGDTSRTLRRKTQSLRAYFRYLRRRGLTTTNPAADVVLAKPDKPLPEFVTAQQMEEILADCQPDSPDCGADETRDALIMELLYSTGIRQAELLALRECDLNASARELRITGKRRKQRVLPVPQELVDKMLAYREELRRQGEVPESFFAGSPGKPLSKTTLYRIVHRSLAGANCPQKSPHTLRHTFATAMLNNGADLNTVKEFLGHSRLDTTQIYTHVSFAEMKRAYAGAHPRSQKADKDR